MVEGVDTNAIYEYDLRWRQATNIQLQKILGVSCCRAQYNVVIAVSCVNPQCRDSFRSGPVLLCIGFLFCIGFIVREPYPPGKVLYLF